MFPSKWCVNMDWPLYLYLLIIIGGFLLVSPLGIKFSAKFRSNQTRMINGILILSFGGYLVSTHTYYIHQKLHEVGGNSGCSAFSVFNCGDVISNDLYNSDPFFGIPWGILGMLSFASVIFILLVLRKSPEDKNIGNWISALVVIPAMGMIPILWLIYVEIFELGVFCQYCTGAHLANLLVLISSYWIYDIHQSGLWDNTPNN